MAGNKKKKTKVRPLLARPGARYTCFGDGLCCTDIHGIGPLTKKEVGEMRRIYRPSAGWNDDHDDYMLNTAADGGCLFLMSDQRCSVHAQLGPEAKPDGCRRFPLGLAATPVGGRITTDHRCPCRTMGDRPEIRPDDVEPSDLRRWKQAHRRSTYQTDPLHFERRAEFLRLGADRSAVSE